MGNDEVLTAILRKRNKNKRIEIPKNDFSPDNKEIPDTIKVIYTNKIDTEQINKIVISKLNLLNKSNEKEKYKKETDYLICKLLEEEKNNLNYIEKYLDICSRYIKIERIKSVTDKFLCKGCFTELENDGEDTEGQIICKICNCINSYLVPNSYFRDIEKTPSGFDEDLNNFSRILDKFEGKCVINFPENFFEKLDNYFRSIDFPIGTSIKEKPLNQKGKKDNTSKKILWNALEKIGYSHYYEDSSYICHVYWGWKLPDLSYYRDKMLQDYQDTQNTWNIIKTKYKRTASLGTQYRLYVQLMAVDYPYVDRDDFKLQENVESLRLHNEAWKKMCEMCNIKYFHVTD